MAGIPWRIRRTETYDLDDGLWLAQPIFHTLENRVGIMDDVFVGWMPVVHPTTGDFVLDTPLSGKAGINKPIIKVDFSLTGSLTISPMHITHPYVEQENVVPPIFTLTETEQTIRLAKSDELLNNGGPNSLENFERSQSDLGYDYLVTKTTTTADIPQLSGNGMLWIDNPDTNLNIHIKDNGLLDTSEAIKNKGNSKQTWHNRGKNVVGFFAALATSTNVGRGLGYRSCVHSPNANTKKLTFSMVVSDFYRPGLTFYTRIGYPGNWQYFETVMAGNGPKQFTFNFDPSKVKAANLNKPLVIDWFYDWYYDFNQFTPGEIKVQLASLTVHEGHIPLTKLNPSFHEALSENSYSEAYGVSRKTVQVVGKYATVDFNKALISSDYRLSLITGNKLKMVDKTRFGFTVFAEELTDTDTWVLGYSTKVVGDVADIL